MAEVDEFLVSHLGPIEDLEVLNGGFWSRAYGFTSSGRPLVVRLGPHRDWYEADRAAMAFSGPDLPVPPVLEIGEALGLTYAISWRCPGSPLEEVTVDQAERTGDLLGRLLLALFELPPLGEPEAWPPVNGGWKAWLESALVLGDDEQSQALKVAFDRDPQLRALHDRGCTRLRQLLPACPEVAMSCIATFFIAMCSLTWWPAE